MGEEEKSKNKFKIKINYLGLNMIDQIAIMNFKVLVPLAINFLARR